MYEKPGFAQKWGGGGLLGEFGHELDRENRGVTTETLPPSPDLRSLPLSVHFLHLPLGVINEQDLFLKKLVVPTLYETPK